MASQAPIDREMREERGKTVWCTRTLSSKRVKGPLPVVSGCLHRLFGVCVCVCVCELVVCGVVLMCGWMSE